MGTAQWHLWAPSVKELEIELIDKKRRVKATRDDHGTFTVERSLIDGPYMLRLDGAATIPDPTAPAVDGVAGPSRPHELEPAATTFRAVPLDQAIIYELHVGTFTEGGTFTSAIEKLPYLAQLGVTHIEVMPVATWSGARNWGYDGAALFAPSAAYGGPEGLRSFVEAAHAQGLAVVLDVVYNHLGPIGNYLHKLGPYFRGDRKTPWGDALNFDGAGSDHVRRFFLDNALMWLRDYGCDGLRLDAIHAISDESARPFLAQLTAEVSQLGADTGRPLCVIAESDLNDPRVIRSRDEGGLGMDAQWCDDFHHALHVVLTGETTGYYQDFVAPSGSSKWERVARALSQGYVYAGEHAPSRGRTHGAPLPSSCSLSHLVGYAQTHDQVGNRAQGDRLSQLVSMERQRIAAALVLTSPFVPMLFAGEEWGASTPWQFFTDHEEHQVAEGTRNGRRDEFKAFGWKPEDIPDPQAEETFLRSKLRWDEIADAPHNHLLAWYRALIKLRHDEPELRSGARTSIAAETQGDVLVVRRGSFAVVVNIGADASVELTSMGNVLLRGTAATALEERVLRIEKDGVAVVRLSQ